MSILNTLPAAFTDWVGQLDRSSRIWMVGGAVRDYFLDRPSTDLDFTVSAPALPLGRELAALLGGELFVLDKERGTIRVLVDHLGEDRRFFDLSELRLPTFEDDLRARDFTINAMAFELREPEVLIDPCGGLRDLKEKILRTPQPLAITNDPLRAIRGVRLACEYGLQIDQATVGQMKAAAKLLGSVARERIRDELFRILALPDPARGVHLLAWFGYIQELLGDVASEDAHLDQVSSYLAKLRAFGRILDVLGPEPSSDSGLDASLGLLAWQLGRFRSPLDAYLKEEVSIFRRRRELATLGLWAAMAMTPAGKSHDPARFVPALVDSLRLSQREGAWLERFTWAFDAISAMTPAPLAVYRYFRESQDAGVAAGLAYLAHQLGQGSPSPPTESWAHAVEQTRLLMEAYFEERSRIEPEVLISGDDLMTGFGLAPGPALGSLLDRLREAQVQGEILDKDQALEWVQRQLDESSWGSRGDRGHAQG
jgi:poly(A) polymerase